VQCADSVPTAFPVSRDEGTGPDAQRLFDYSRVGAPRSFVASLPVRMSTFHGAGTRCVELCRASCADTRFRSQAVNSKNETVAIKKMTVTKGFDSEVSPATPASHLQRPFTQWTAACCTRRRQRLRRLHRRLTGVERTW